MIAGDPRFEKRLGLGNPKEISEVATLTDMGEIAPVAPRDRIAVLDVLRGFALWGVLIGNTMWIYSSRWYIPDTAQSALDLPAVWFIKLFVDSKAMTLLTFMFGLGFAIQLVRGEGKPVRRTFARRLAVLFLLGWCHVLFLWWGDVTWTYALMGFPLLAFAGVRDRWLLVWSAILIFVPGIVLAIPQIGAPFWSLLPDRQAHLAAYVEAMRNAPYLALVVAHAKQALVHSFPGFLWYMPWELGHFLLGLYAGRHRIFDNNGADHLRLWRHVFAVSLVLALAGIAFQVTAHFALFTKHPPYELTLAGEIATKIADGLATLSLVACYVSTIVLLFQRAWARRVLILIAPAGRMPLTNYYLHSVVMTTVFYGRGFALAGKLSFAACLGLALATYPVIVALAHLWLRYFRFGPVEWLWRTLSYGQRQPMRV